MFERDDGLQIAVENIRRATGPGITVAGASSSCTMRSIRDLELIHERLGPESTVAEALAAMRIAGATFVAVVEGEECIGVVSHESTRYTDLTTRLREVMRGCPVELDESVPARRAAAIMLDSGSEVACVNRGGHFVGLLTPLRLLSEMNRSWDPLTGLSWSDRIREWGVRSLEAGREIMIVFIDLDDFGAYNKRHGHIVGDRVIKAAAAHFGKLLHPETDVLVRYAGDEFAIGSVRPRDAIEQMVRSLQQNAIRVEGIDEAVRYSIGLSGGKRTKERDRDHFASTVDNLINIASKAALSQKQEVARTIPTVGPKLARVSFVSVSDDLETPVAVAVEVEGRIGSAVASRVSSSALQAVAQATCLALHRADSSFEVRPVDTVVFRRADGTIAVSFRGIGESGGQGNPLHATQPVSGSVYQAVAEAVVASYTEHRPAVG